MKLLPELLEKVSNTKPTTLGRLFGNISSHKRKNVVFIADLIGEPELLDLLGAIEASSEEIDSDSDNDEPVLAQSRKSCTTLKLNDHPTSNVVFSIEEEGEQPVKIHAHKAGSFALT